MTTTIIQESGLPSALAAQVAPLPATLAQYSFTRRWETEAALAPVYSKEQAALRFHHIWQTYLADVRLARAHLFEEIDLPVERDKHLPPRQKQLGIHWLRGELALKRQDQTPGKPVVISPDTITRLIDTHLLRRDSWGVYDWQSVAALSICRRIDQVRERNWLPERVPEQEAWWWCWSQEGPKAARVPCPYPAIPIDLPPSTVLYTRWAGASWSDASWLKVGYVGAITFAGLIRDVRAGTSTMRLSDLEIWDSGISQQPLPPLMLSGEDDLDPREGLNFSIGLAEALSALGQYQESSGLLTAPITHVPDIRGGKGHATVQLHQGKMRSCLVTDQKGQRHPIEQETLLRLDKKHGPFAWSFHRFSEDLLLRNGGYQRFFRERALAVLEHLASWVFSPAHLDDL